MLRKDDKALVPIKSPGQHPVLSGGRVGIMSADNPAFDPEIQGGHHALGQELSDMGLHSESTIGRYNGPERSYIIHNPTRDQMARLGEKYGQESIVFSDRGDHELLYTNGPEKGKCRHANGFEYFDRAPDDFYTALPGVDGSPMGYFRIPFNFDQPAGTHAPTPQVVAKALGKALRERIDAYHLQLLEMRKKELAKAYQQTARHSEPGIHERQGKRHSEPGIHERPAVQVDQPESQSIAQKNELLDKKAPPGFSEETMHELKTKYGEESAFKIAWAAHKKHKGKKAENEMSKKTTQDPREFAGALAKAITEFVKSQAGAIEAGESDATGAASGIQGSGEHATASVKKEEVKADKICDKCGGKHATGDHAAWSLFEEDMPKVLHPSDKKKKIKKDEHGAIETGEVSAEGAGKGIPGSGEHATKAVSKGEDSADDEVSDDDAYMPACPDCGGEGKYMGQLGRRFHLRCRDCGSDYSKESNSKKSPTKKAEGGALDVGEVSAEGAGKGIPGSGEHATKSVKKADVGGESVVSKVPGVTKPPTLGMTEKAEVPGTIQTGEVSAEGAAPFPGSGEKPLEAVAKADIPMSSAPTQFPGVPCSNNCGRKLNPVEVLLSYPHGNCGRCIRAAHAAVTSPQGKPVSKYEDMIDRPNESDREKRIKEVGATKGRKLPSDPIKEMSAPGSGGQVTKGRGVKKDEISAGESSGEGAGKGIPGSGEHATKAVKKDEMAAFSSPQSAGMQKSPGSVRPTGVPGAPKPPQAAGAKPSMVKDSEIEKSVLPPDQMEKSVLPPGELSKTEGVLLDVLRKAASGKCKDEDGYSQHEFPLRASDKHGSVCKKCKKHFDFCRQCGDLMDSTQSPKSSAQEHLCTDTSSCDKCGSTYHTTNVHHIARPDSYYKSEGLAKAGMTGMANMPKDMHAMASQDSHKAAVQNTVPPAAEQKAVPKPTSAYDAKQFMPSPVQPAKPFVSPVKAHLDRMKSTKPSGGLPMAPLKNVVGKPAMKAEDKMDLCKNCGKPMNKGHTC